MIVRCRIELTPDRVIACRPEWGYHLYAALLERGPQGYAQKIHQDGPSPVSQYLCARDGRILWTVTLLGEEAREALAPLLEAETVYRLKREQVELRATLRTRDEIATPEAMFLRAAAATSTHALSFNTPTAFKSRGEYQILPTPRLILQSLMKKWNACFPECPIEDEDGQGMEAMATGLLCRHYRLRDQPYHIKDQTIPGFVGELTLENRLTGFHRQLADALLYFADYAGIGIKTTLGMGGTEHRA